MRPCFSRRLLGLLCCFCLFSVILGGCGAKKDTDGRVRPSAGNAKSAAEAAPEAREAYERAVALWHPSLSSALAAERCSDPEQAVTLLDAAISREPDFADAHARRGLALSELGRREEAFDDLTRAIRLRPKAEYYAYRGLTSIRARQDKPALRDLEYALSLDPEQPRAHNYLGVLELGRGSASQACSRFTRGCAKGDCSFIEAARKENLCP